MIIIIPCAGFHTRFSGSVAKTLCMVGCNTILEQLLNKTKQFPTIVITNALNYKDIKEVTSNYGNVIIYNNHTTEENPTKGCLHSVTECLQVCKVEDDILIVVGDIVFDFDLVDLSGGDEVLVPVKKTFCDQIKKAGWIDIDTKGCIMNCVIHPDFDIIGYFELGIYYIPKHLLGHLNRCVRIHRCDAPGHFLTYLLFYKEPIKAMVVEGFWDHVTTQDDLVRIRAARRFENA